MAIKVSVLLLMKEGLTDPCHSGGCRAVRGGGRRGSSNAYSCPSLEQIRRQSPMPVLSAHGVRAAGVKPWGSPGLAQPTAMGRIKFPESSVPEAFQDLWAFILAVKWEARKSRNNC